MAWRRHHGTDTAIVRIFNTYGPRLRLDDGRVVTNLLTQALAGQPLTVCGDGSQTRSLCYVSDQVDGIVALLHSPLAGPVNIGNPDEVSVLELAHEVLAVTGAASPVVHQPRPADDPVRRRPDISAARRQLSWQPTVEAEVVVVDDGSTDSSGKILGALEDSTVWVVTHPRNRGEGAAIRSGLPAARGDLVLFHDADPEHDPDDWPGLLEPLLGGDGHRRLRQPLPGHRDTLAAPGQPAGDPERQPPLPRHPVRPPNRRQGLRLPGAPRPHPRVRRLRLRSRDHGQAPAPGPHDRRGARGPCRPPCRRRPQDPLARRGCHGRRAGPPPPRRRPSHPDRPGHGSGRPGPGSGRSGPGHGGPGPGRTGRGPTAPGRPQPRRRCHGPRRALVGRALVGRVLVGRVLVGRVLVGRVLVGRVLARRPWRPSGTGPRCANLGRCPKPDLVRRRTDGRRWRRWSSTTTAASC